MDKKSVQLSLPSVPKDLYYEHYIAALLMEGGYFIDRSIHKKVDKAGEIFEVDIITYSYTEGKLERQLLELKSGDWSRNDVFKVRGWMDFIGIDKGAFIVQKIIDETKFSRWKELYKTINIDLIDNHIQADDSLYLDDIIRCFKLSKDVNDSILESSRYGFALEHCMRKYLSQLKKSQNDRMGLSKLWRYSLDVQDV